MFCGGGHHHDWNGWERGLEATQDLKSEKFMFSETNVEQNHGGTGTQLAQVVKHGQGAVIFLLFVPGRTEEKFKVNIFVIFQKGSAVVKQIVCGRLGSKVVIDN